MVIFQFIVAFIATLGFAVLFNVPKRSIIFAALTGGLGWVAYSLVISNSETSIVFATLIGSIIVGLTGEILARVRREAVTVFVIPGIIPLVPGAGMYYTMLAFIEKDFDKLGTIGIETLFMAGSIAVGLLMISSIFRAGKHLYEKIKV